MVLKEWPACFRQAFYFWPWCFLWKLGVGVSPSGALAFLDAFTPVVVSVMGVGFWPGIGPDLGWRSSLAQGAGEVGRTLPVVCVTPLSIERNVASWAVSWLMIHGGQSHLPCPLLTVLARELLRSWGSSRWGGEVTHFPQS